MMFLTKTMIKEYAVDTFKDELLNAKTQGERNEIISDFGEWCYKLANRLCLEFETTEHYQEVCDFIEETLENMSNAIFKYYTFNYEENEMLYNMYRQNVNGDIDTLVRYIDYIKLIEGIVTDFSNTPYEHLSSRYVRLATEFMDKCLKRVLYSDYETGTADLDETLKSRIYECFEVVRQIRYNKVKTEIGHDKDLYEMASFEWGWE